MLDRLLELLKGVSRISFGLPLVGIELDIRQALDPRTIDERLARLDQIKSDLHAAAEAVSELQREAHENKREAATLKEAVERLQQDRQAAETLLRIPEESFARMLARASAKARFRGIAEARLSASQRGRFQATWCGTSPSNAGFNGLRTTERVDLRWRAS